jgi:hypothetical protein
MCEEGSKEFEGNIYDELLTIVTEVEAILNSRPISYVSSEDIEEPLTPSHLSCGRRLLSLPNIVNGNDEKDPDWQPNKSEIVRKGVHLEKLIEHFWKRWRNEYLLELRESHRLRIKNTPQRKVVRVGDAVVVRDDTPRVSWKIGRVEELILVDILPPLVRIVVHQRSQQSFINLLNILSITVY